MITSCIDSLSVLLHPGTVAELRILNAGPKRTISGYFNDISKMAAAAERWSGRVPAVYTTLNPVLPDLLARASNRVIENARSTTTDRDIVKRIWLPIDFDVTRPAGISSTEEEHEAALARARVCRQFLREHGWPDPIFADSGNGAHLDYQIDLPTESTLVQRVLEFLARKFDQDTVHIDTGMFNPARIWKLYGTRVCKGDSTPDRPHRDSTIIELPDPIVVLSANQIEDLIGPEPAKPFSSDRPYEVRREFDLDAWLEKYQHRLPPLGIKRAWNGSGWKRDFEYCPWNQDHTNNSAYVACQPSGAAVAGCHHHGCQSKTWHDLKSVVGDARTGIKTQASRDMTSQADTLGHSYEELMNVPPIRFAIEGFLQEEGVTLIGGLSGHGKTLIMLAMARAMLEGGKLFHRFNVNTSAKKVIYLIPECGLGPFAYRVKLFGLMDHVREGRFICRTLSKKPISLNSLLLLAEVQGADVFLDTVTRFKEGDENDAGENNEFAESLFNLQRFGARTVVGAHHAPKGFAKETFMTLENILRGTGDIGAMLATCWGLRQIDKDKNRIYVQNVKPRDFQPCEPFIIQARPSLDQAGYFELTDPPGFAGELADHVSKDKGGRPAIDEEKIIEAYQLHAQGKSQRQIAEKLNVGLGTVNRWLRNPEVQ